MKKIFLTLTITGVVSLLFYSCKKDKGPEPTYQTITQALKANESYQYDLGSFGDEEGAHISTQAKNFSISEVEQPMSSANRIYKYVPALNYVGTDEVVLRSARGSDGVSRNDKIILTTIKFTITN